MLNFAPHNNIYPMKITRIGIHNFLKLKDVEFNPSQTNVIVGRNRQGKTSILKAIKTALTGDADSTSIRIGESKAEITLDVGDLMIKRTITEKGNYLDISNKDGMKMPSPASYLSGLIGSFSFNPIEFFDKKPADRKKYLLNAITLTITPEELGAYTGELVNGLDYSAHALEVVEQARKYYYDKRTVANAEKVKKQKSLLDLTSKIPEGFNPRDVTEEQITKLREAIEKETSERQRKEGDVKLRASLEQQEKDITSQIEALTARLKEVQSMIVSNAETQYEMSDDVSFEAAKATLQTLESQREVIFTAKRADEVRAELDAALGEAEKLDMIVKRLTKEVPEDLIKKAQLPVDGLSISGDDILVNGVSIDNLSSSEQIRFGLQIARALNGEFKVLCVDGLELLDREAFTFFLNEIKDDDFQYFVTRVDGDTPYSITVEDGEIKK